MSERAIFFGFSFRHHGPHTAFHGLARALADQRVIDASPPWPRGTPHALEWRLNWRWLLASEYRLLRHYRARRRQVIHYFFPENTMRHAHRWKGPHALVATCHQPVARLADREQDARTAAFITGLRACDAIVVQCESHVEPYRRFLPGVPVHCIPLGVDTDYFRPAAAGADEPGLRVLTVGNWLRDYPVWAETARRIAAEIPDAEFTVVANPDTLALARKALGRTPVTARFLSGISDDALLAEYRRATLFFLPLTDAMANDALLEALATGTPMVVTDLPATRDYAGETAYYVPAGQPEAAASALLRLARDPGAQRECARNARLRAERHFAWNVVADRYRSIYKGLLAGRT